MTETSLESVVTTTLGKMPWLTPADEALKELALKLAREIDSAGGRAEEFADLDGRIGQDDESDVYWRLRRLESWCDLAKTVGLLGPKLRDVLRDLGGAPGARKDLDTAPQKSAGKLATMQANAERMRLVKGGKGANAG